jgi:ornithine carrier protein
MVETAALFLSYTCFQNAIRKFSSNHSSGQPARLSIPELGVAAAGAGFVTSFIL